MTEKEICSICYETYETDKIKIVLGCNHSFHFNCLKKWKNEDKDSCPLCRGKMNIELTTQKQEEKEEKDEETEEVEIEEVEIEEENKEEKGNTNNTPNQQNNNLWNSIISGLSRARTRRKPRGRPIPRRRRIQRVRTGTRTRTITIGGDLVVYLGYFP